MNAETIGAIVCCCIVGVFVLYALWRFLSE
jgi:hypothetical protein